MAKRPPELRIFTGAGTSRRPGMIVDCFAGGGGASTGLEHGLGRSADIAINHDAEAIALHERNHPDTAHFREDIWRVDPHQATGSREVDLLWASPDCKHFSKARGARPVSKKIRGLAWTIVHWCQQKRPKVVLMENVEEFVTWGPTVPILDEDGQPKLDAKSGLPLERPCPKRKGVTFRRFVAKLRKLGYDVEWRELWAHDFGAPTKRKRLFLVARCDGRPIVWPAETHGTDENPHRTAGEIIDWSLPTPSIFDAAARKANGQRGDLAPATLARIADGIDRYVVQAQTPFIVRTGHAKSGTINTFRGQGLDTPLGTVCATNDKNLVLPYLRRAGSQEPGSTEPLIAAWIMKNYGKRGTKGYVVGHGMERPLGTITTQDHHSLVTAFLVKYYGATRQLQRCDEPLHTIPTRDRFGLVTLHGTPYEIVDIGMRMLQPRELYNAQGFPVNYHIDRTIHGDAITKTAQLRMVGNSVAPPVAAALARANDPTQAAA